ncbi:MAG: hypothetical protein QOG62_1123 [Thermoleophilaceae bacterium]|nr:hypothetical protein [Thermoleophilaceae bacterium]
MTNMGTGETHEPRAAGTHRAPMIRGRRLALVAGLTVALVAALGVGSASARPAYVPSFATGQLTGFDLGADGTPSALPGSPFAAGVSPQFPTMTPDGEHLYFSDVNGDDLGIYDVDAAGGLSNSRTTGALDAPRGVAMSPDGDRLFVADDNHNQVSVFDVAADGGLSNQRNAATSTDPFAIAVDPSGEHLWVACSADVDAFDIAADGSLSNRRPFSHLGHGEGITVTPDGQHLYSTGAGGVTAHDIAADGSLQNRRDTAGNFFGAAVSLDGTNLYVTPGAGSDLQTYDIAPDGSLGNGRTTGIGGIGRGVSLTPDDEHVVVAARDVNQVKVYDRDAAGTLSNERSLAASNPQMFAIRPNRSPLAAFTSAPANAGSPTSFDATTSSDPDGTVARYDWDFGDGNTLPNGGPAPAHTYATAGNFIVELTVTDNEGCSTALLYTGQIASCTGGAAAQATANVVITSAGTAPETTITKKPTRKRPKRSILRFQSSEANSTFTCVLDGSDGHPCTSPQNYADLNRGRHTLQVAARDAEGNTDTSPAQARFFLRGKR